MKPNLATLLVLACLPLLRAEEVSIRLPEPPVHLTLPDGWELDNLMDQWLQGWSPDRSVWISGIVMKGMSKEQLLKWLPKHLDTFGVTAVIDEESLKSSEVEVAKHKATEFRMTAKIEDTNQRIYLYAVPLAPERTFVFTTGGKVEDRNKHLEAVTRILNSLREATPTAESPKD